MAHDIFISYSSRDKDVAHAACAAIERRGRRCWIAPRDIMPGQEWGEAIVDAIRGARIFILILSASTAASSQVRREVERAANQDLPIVPFRIEDVQPSKSLEYFISGAHWLDAIAPPMERHYEYLADVAMQLLGEERAAIRPTAPAPAPAGSRPVRRWLPAAAAALVLLGAGATGLVLLGPWDAVSETAPATTPAESQAKVPDVSRTIFTRRAVPARGDKPLRLRAGPSGDSPELAVIGTDEVFRVAPRQGDWWPARLPNGLEGYVSHRFISVLDEERPAPKQGG